MTKVVPLKNIIIDAGTQIRTGLNAEHVADLTEAYGRGDSVPPVDVFQTFAGGLILAEGFHRVEAAEKAGLKEIQVTIHRGEKKDALKFALSANTTHGLKRSNADKGRAVEIALKEWPNLTNRAIAELCGVNHRTVSAHRPDIQNPGGEILHVENEDDPEKKDTEPSAQNGKSSSGTPLKRIGRDGKEYRVSSGPPPPKPKLDKVGKPIPDAIIPLWNRADEFSGAASISTLRGIIQKAQDENDLAFAELSFSSVQAHLDQAYADLKVVKPHAICPTCQGLNRTKCTMCKGRGFVSKFYFEHFVSVEAQEMQKR
jgi:hypothetical protein